jgi:RNA polymerase sigma-70 factor, ECF subfamily
VKGGRNMEIAFSADDQFREVLSTYSNMVYRLALSRTKNVSDAEDILQEVFLRLVNKRPEFTSEEHRKAWLIRVTVNCSNKLITSAWFRRTTPLKEELKFETKEKSDVYYAVLELPLKYRTVIHLFYYEDLSIAQISHILSMKESTIKSQLLRARHLLKIKLKGEFDHE